MVLVDHWPFNPFDEWRLGWYDLDVLYHHLRNDLLDTLISRDGEYGAYRVSLPYKAPVAVSSLTAASRI